MSWPPDPVRYTEEAFRRALPTLEMRLAAWPGTGHPYAKARPDPPMESSKGDPRLGHGSMVRRRWKCAKTQP